MASGITRLSAAAGIGFTLGAITFIAVMATLPSTPEIRAATEPVSRFLSSVARPWQPQGLETTIVKAPRVLFVGDMMFDRHVAERIKASGVQTYAFDKLPNHWFDQFDFAVANLEGPATDVRRDPVKTIDFAFDSSIAPLLKGEGIDAVSQANNHALDQGTAGFDDSRSALQSRGLLVFGHQVRDDEIAMATTTINGVRFAFLGFNTTDNPLDKAAAERVIKEAKASSDRVVVFAHWGSEYKHEPDAAVVGLAHWFIDHGADAVIGGHPHWTQGISSYKGHPIAYSLGNFIFDQDFSAETQQGLGVAFTFEDKNIVLELIPIQIDASQPRVVEGDERVTRLKALAEISDLDLKAQIESGIVRF